MPSQDSLGTQLRLLIERLDGGVQRIYDAAGLTYRPRYTPVVRVLADEGPGSIRSIARATGLTHSAASQTVAQMARDELVTLRKGKDQREQIVVPAQKLKAMMPILKDCWRDTQAAADELDAELSHPLSALVGEALEALDRVPFQARIGHSRRGEPS